MWMCTIIYIYLICAYDDDMLVRACALVGCGSTLCPVRNVCGVNASLPYYIKYMPDVCVSAEWRIVGCGGPHNTACLQTCAYINQVYKRPGLSSGWWVRSVLCFTLFSRISLDVPEARMHWNKTSIDTTVLTRTYTEAQQQVGNEQCPESHSSSNTCFRLCCSFN